MKRSIREASGCLTWQGAKNTRGYGQVKVHDKLKYVHRLAYESKYGPLPEGLELDHLCRNRACAEISHLEPVTHGENLRRRAKPATCRSGHPWTPENRLPRPGNRTDCRPCRRERKRIARQLKRLANRDG